MLKPTRIGLFWFSTMILAIAAELSTFRRSTQDHLPPPLPEEKWIGKSNLNYDLLHGKLVDILVCLDTPVGVFGFYWLFSLIASDLQLMYHCHQIRNSGLEGSWKRFVRLLGGLGLSAFEVFSFVQSLSTYKGCRSVDGFHVVKISTIYRMVASSGMGTILVASAYLFKSEGSASLGSHFVLMGTILNYSCGIVLFFSVAAKAGVLKQILMAPDAVMVDSVMTASAGVYSGHFWYFFIPSIACLPLVAGVGGNMLLGKMVGDPWGSYLVRRLVGKIAATLTRVIPVLEGIFVVCDIKENPVIYTVL